MPVYNGAKYLKESIDSILSQSYKDFEFLIIDDGSTDNTIEIINQYKDSRIKLVRNFENKGLPYTRNKFLELATGEYIALMDSDDISYKNRIKEQVEFLNNNINIDVVGSRFDSLIDGRIKKRFLVKSKEKIDVENDIIKTYLMFGNVLANPSVMFRREIVINNNIKYRKECFVAQDYAFWIDLKSICNFHIIQKKLIAYRFGHENITKKSMNEKAVQRSEILSKLRNRCIENNGFNLNENDYKLLNKMCDDRNLDFTANDVVLLMEVLNKMINQNKIFKDKKIIGLSDNLKAYFTPLIAQSNINVIEKFKFIVYKFEEEKTNKKFINYFRFFKNLKI